MCLCSVHLIKSVCYLMDSLVTFSLGHSFIFENVCLTQVPPSRRGTNTLRMEVHQCVTKELDAHR